MRYYTKNQAYKELKIIGYTYYAPEVTDMYLKPDSALLVNNKPFFLPDFADTIVAKPCLIARIEKMGRNIAEKFADRYYDAVAFGMNVQTAEAKQANDFWGHICAAAFDNSMIVGHFTTKQAGQYQLKADGSECALDKTIFPFSQAITAISRYITLRTGDMIAVDFIAEPVRLQREMLLEAWADNEQVFRCRIK